jgi:hypothetical protein
MSFKIYNGAMPTTTAMPRVATGTAIKTMLQVAPPATKALRAVSWGYSMDALQTGVIELIQTDVAATVTAHTGTGIIRLDPNALASTVTLGVNATGFTATVEGTIAATRLLDMNNSGAVGTGTYNYQFLPNEVGIISASTFLRVRATMGTTTNMTTWIVYEEVG